MALTISGTSNGKLGNLSLSASTGDILDSANTTFFGVDAWYITANKTPTSSTAALDANWVRLKGNAVTNAVASTLEYFDEGTGVIGNAMTQSSGIFTFPSTGIWRIDFRTSTVSSSTSNDLYYPYVIVSKDNFTNEGSPILATDNLDNQQTAGQMCTCIFDVQDTSNYKCRFQVGSITNGYVSGDTSYMRTYALFTKLGET